MIKLHIKYFNMYNTIENDLRLYFKVRRTYMSLFDLFNGRKISNGPFKLERDEILTVKNAKYYTFYLEGKGINCNATVKKGEEVEVGQVLGKEKEDLSIPVLSTVKGTVLEIKDVINPEGKKVKAVIVEAVETMEDEKLKEKGEINLSSLNKEDILNKLQEFALSDENAVPLSIKYRAFSGKKILIKAFSYEPNLVYYDVLAKKEKEINKALEVLKVLVNSAEIKVAGRNVSNLEGKKPSDAIIELKRDALIKEYFGEEVMEEEVVVEDLSTLIYLGECFVTGNPHLEEYLVISGGAISKNVIGRIKIGTGVQDILNSLDRNNEKIEKLVIGGVLKGIPQGALEVALGQNSKAISFLTKKDISSGEEFSCIRCGKCIRVCKEGLNPIKLVELWERGEKEEFLKFGGKRCIECGLCSYVCPSKIEVANKIVTGKTFI